MEYNLMQVLSVLILVAIGLGVIAMLRQSRPIEYKCWAGLSVLSVLAAVGLLVMAVLPYGNFYGVVQNTIPTDKKVVALTFDDGPYPPYTQELLKVLAAENVKATFFMVGANAAAHPELARQVAQAGHVIGVHTLNHIDLQKLDKKQQSYQIAVGKMVLQQLTGVEPHLFRPPHGFRDWQVLDIAKHAGLKTVNWSVLSKDWLNPSAQEIATRTLAQVKPGSIILLHDGDSPYNKESRANTVQAVKIIIKELKAQGYEFVTIQ